MAILLVNAPCVVNRERQPGFPGTLVHAVQKKRGAVASKREPKGGYAKGPGQEVRRNDLRRTRFPKLIFDPTTREGERPMNAADIKEHMDVMASDGQKVGQVDHMEGKDKIKLTKHDAPDGKHHFIPVSWVSKIDSKVHLNKAAKDVKAQWSEAA
jgi:hypothetical protein